MLGLAALNCSGACAAERPNKAALCRITFDYSDPAIVQLNTSNLRALCAWQEVCQD